MRLYVSIRPFVPGKSGGIIGYLENIVSALARIEGLEIHTGHIYCNLREIGRDWPTSVVRHPLYGIEPRISAGAEHALIAQLQPDWVLHFYPFFETPYLTDGRTRTASCIPDIQHVHQGPNFSIAERRDRDEHFSEAIAKSDFVFTLSQYCCDDIAAHYPGAAGKVFEVAPAVPLDWTSGFDRDAERDRIASALNLPVRYLVYPANAWPHKNHVRLLEALRLLRKRGTIVPVVLTGDDASGKLAHLVADAGLQDSIRVLGYVSTRDLRALIARADALVYPSLFEGFGIPVLEAFAVGTAVTCSDCCSLPEVGGAAAIYFDAERPTDIADTIERVWNDSDVRARSVTLGREQLEKFSYEQSARELVRLLTVPGAQRAAGKEHAITVRELPLVSVVTPSFQQAQFLRACIDSVLAQDYPNIDYAVFDGGSTDGSVDVLKSYGAKFFWRSERDGGQTQAINAGLRRARGDILAYLNSDDLLLPGAIHRVIDAFGRNPSADLIYGAADYIDEHGAVKGPYISAPYDPETLRARCVICQPATFWRRRTKERYGLFDEQFQLAMDYEYWQRIAVGGGFLLHIPEKLACSRDYATTKTRGQRERVFRDIFATQRQHWGRIHYSWCYGYLDYLAKETPWWRNVWTSVTPEKLHAKALRLESNSDQRPRKPSPAPARPLAQEITGLFADGWLAPDFAVELSVPEARTVYFELMSPWQGTFSLAINGERLLSTEVTSGQRFRLEAKLPLTVVKLKVFGPHHQLSAHDTREATALLLGTNCLR